MMDDCMAAGPEPPRERLPAQVVERIVVVAEDRQEQQAVEDSRWASGPIDSRRVADTAVAEDSRRALGPEPGHTAVVPDRARPFGL